MRRDYPAKRRIDMHIHMYVHVKEGRLSEVSFRCDGIY